MTKSNDKFYMIQANSSASTEGQNTNVYSSDARGLYSRYDAMVAELYAMYYNQANFGCSLTKTLVDIRTNLIASEGCSVIAKNEKTQKWIENFIKDNKLNTSKLISMIRTGEMEGKVLNLLIPSKKEKRVKVYPISYNENAYFVESNYDEIDAVWQLDKKKKQTEKYKNYVLTKLNGSSYNYNMTPPTLGNVIENIKAIDIALNDFRESNRLFGFPTAAIEAKTGEDAEEISKAMAAKNWAIGNAFASTGKLYFPSVPQSYNALTKEIEVQLKQISSISSVPVHWLGYVELMSNRSVADELENMIKIGTQKDRTIWADTMTDIILMAMRMSVDKGYEDAVFDKDFSITIPYLSPQYTAYLSTVYLPLYQNNVISKQELRSFIPSLDVLCYNEAEEIDNDLPTNLDENDVLEIENV